MERPVTVPILSIERRYQMALAIDRWFENLGDHATAKHVGSLLGIKKEQIDRTLAHVRGWRTGLRPVPPHFMEKLYRETGDPAFRLTASEAEKYRARGAKFRPTDEWPQLTNDEAAELLKGIVVPEKFISVAASTTKGRSDRRQEKELAKGLEDITSVPSRRDEVSNAYAAFLNFLGQLAILAFAVRGDDELRRMVHGDSDAQLLLASLVPPAAAPPAVQQPPTTLIQRVQSVTAELIELSRRSHDDSERVAARNALVGHAMRMFEAATMLGLEFPAEFPELIAQFEVIHNALKKRR